MGDLLVKPEDGSVAFGSGKECWAFTLTRCSRMLAARFKVEPTKLIDKLWGENYYDIEAKCWRKEGVSATGKNLHRGFAQFIMDPIIRLTNALMEGNMEAANKMIDANSIKMTSDMKALTGKHLLKAVMAKWINAADTLLEMMVCHLPSPRKAQKYRTAYLYEGPQDDEIAVSMRECNPKGPLMMFVSKMVPTTDKGRFFAFGRVFSGTIAASQKVRILGANYKVGKKDDLFEKSVQRTVLMMGRTVEFISDVPCGNTCGLVGVDQYIMKTGTITDHPEAHTIRCMKYSVSPVVRVAV